MFRAGALILLTTIFLSGCATRGNVDLLETRLRQQENQLYATRNKLEEKETALQSAQREVHSLQAQLGPKTTTASYPEQTHLVAQAEGIKFNKLRTGGLNENGQEGDDVVSAVLVPYDGSDELVKLPGQVEFRLYDLSQPKGQQQLGSWKYDPEETSGHWHKGFLTSGYLFKLPWQTVPSNKELTLIARFTTPDGRTFQANHLVNVDPPQMTVASRQVSYQAEQNSLLPLQQADGQVNESGQLAKQSNIQQTVNRIDSDSRVELTPQDEADSKSNYRMPVPTSSSRTKYDSMKYH